MSKEDWKCNDVCHLREHKLGGYACICDVDSDVLVAHARGERCGYCVNEYGYCVHCGYRAGVACTCGMTFAEKIKHVGIDEEALRIFNMGGKGRKRGKDSNDNKRGA